MHKPQTISMTVYPNPFNSSCVITAPAEADVEIYDLRGNVITSYSSRQCQDSFVPLNKGDRNRVSAKVSGGSALAQGVFIWQPDETISSGIYFVRARIGDGNSITKRIVYLK